MDLHFLGTSHGVPSADRYCQSILAQTAQGGILIDAGAPVMDLLLRMDYPLTSLRTVLLTHLHGDHTNGLLSLMDLSAWYFQTMSYDVWLPEEQILAPLEKLLSIVVDDTSYPTDRIRTHIVSEGVLQDDGVRITAFPTGHMRRHDRPAYGYLLEEDGKRVYISGDLAGGEADLPAFLTQEPVDLLVCECAHFPAQVLLERLEHVHAARIAVVHVYPLEKYDLLHAARPELLFPADGDVIRV